MEHTDKKRRHEPVLLDVVEKYTNLSPGDTVIDCTLGLGGHSELFLKQIGKKGKLIAFEQDERNLAEAQKKLNKYKDRITFIHTNFVHLQHEIEKLKISGVNLIFFDLGIASTHVDDPEKGFSFMQDGPLDMRLDPRSSLTAEKVLKTYSEKRLIDIFRKYGEERYAKKLAAKIKENLPINTTKQLADLIEKYSPKNFRKKGKKIHPATRIFQALRIEVNDELNVLENALTQAIDLLKPKGRLIAISYHSLEDRIVKRAIKAETKDCICPPEIPICVCNHKKRLNIITKKPIVPGPEETGRNTRSRSAKMRVAEKI